MTLAAATAIGVGGMIGGIFAVVPVATEIAGTSSYLAFALGGVIALLTGTSYARLSARYPSRGGTVTLLNRAFGPTAFAGTLNVLLWLGYFMMLALYAVTFATYAADLFGLSGRSAGRALGNGAIVVLTVLNLVGARAAARTQTILVWGTAGILAVLAVRGLASAETRRILPPHGSIGGSAVVAGMIAFLAYEGFELIGNTAADTEDPARILPRAFYLSIGGTAVLYTLVTLAALGALGPRRVVAEGGDALGRAADAYLGSVGAAALALAAAAAAASALNATLYGTARLTYVMAKSGELPEDFTRDVTGQPVLGLLVTVGGALVVVNLANVSSISLIGSAIFLALFACVNVGCVLLHREAGGGWLLPAVAATACAASVVAVLAYAGSHGPLRLLVLGGLLAAALAIAVNPWLARAPAGS